MELAHFIFVVLQSETEPLPQSNFHEIFSGLTALN